MTELAPPHEAQPRPVLVERRDLHVDEPHGQRDVADVLVVDVAVVATGAPRPGDPQCPRGEDLRGERSPLRRLRSLLVGRRLRVWLGATGLQRGRLAGVGEVGDYLEIADIVG